MRQFITSVAAFGLSLAFVTSTQAAPNKSGSHPNHAPAIHTPISSGVQHNSIHTNFTFNKNFNYNQHGVSSLSYSHQVWSKRFGCYQYWCPSRSCWYFWVPTYSCYVPCEYLPTVCEPIIQEPVQPQILQLLPPSGSTGPSGPIGTVAPPAPPFE